MRTVSRSGLAAGLFAPWRYSDPDARCENPDFVFNQPAYRDASILLAGENFGCGSSREHAVWALLESGFRAIVAPSFATIFHNNAQRNGLLTVELADTAIDALTQWVSADPQRNTVRIDLDICTIAYDPHQAVLSFSIDATTRNMLLNGLDEIGLTEQSMDRIAAFEERDQPTRPWVYLEER